MEKPSVSLLNAVNNAPFPTAKDGHERFVLAEPGQTFKVFVVLKRPSSIAWPEGSTHLRVTARLDGKIRMRSKFISRQNLAAFLTHADEPDEVQVILDSLLEQHIVYSERRRPSFSKAVIELQQTDPTSWTSQAGLVEVEVAAGKLVKQPGQIFAGSAEPATVKSGEECKPFYAPALRAVPSVAVRHSEATPEPRDEQAIAGGVAKFSESSIVMPPPAHHGFFQSASLASVKVKYDSKEHVKLRREHTENKLAYAYKFAGQQWKRPRRNAELNELINNSYKEVCTLETSIVMTCTYAHPISCVLALKQSIYTCHSNVLRSCRCLCLWTSQVLKSIETCTCLALSV